MRWSRMVTVVGRPCRRRGRPGGHGRGGRSRGQDDARQDAPPQRATTGSAGSCVRAARQRPDVGQPLLAPTRPGADAAFLVMQAGRLHAMSGRTHVRGTVLLETGRCRWRAGDPSRWIPRRASWWRAPVQGGRCERVTSTTSPRSRGAGQTIEIEGLGTLRAESPSAAIYYAWSSGGWASPSTRRTRARSRGRRSSSRRGGRSRFATRRWPAWTRLLTSCSAARSGRRRPHLQPRCGPGRVDRSPCGTGSCGQSRRAARARAGQRRRHAALALDIGGEFAVESSGDFGGGRPAVLPRITGQAWIYGTEQLRLDERDRSRIGFALSDTWGPDAG